jgi:hypothetical protein
MPTMNEKPEIPQHTKWGIRVSAVIILLITIMIIKNCMGSFMYGVSTEQELQKQYYELGYSHGLQKAQGLESSPAPETENLLLRKLYRKGYRDGWDSAAQSEEKAMTPGETPKADQ